MICVNLLTVFSLCAGPKPKADAHLRITGDLPKLKITPTLYYDGVFSITNTGDVAFVIVTDKDWSGETTRFYEEGDEEQQRLEDEFGRGTQRREEERREVTDFYHHVIEKYPELVKTLQPGESSTFESKFVFRLPFNTPAGIYKAEMFLGGNTWIPVNITPTLGMLFPIERDKKGMPAGTFYYSQEGTNQYLYVKEGDKFKRASEMKLKSRPEKDDKDGAVTFDTPDGSKKRLTQEQARQVIHEREQRKKQE